jgi:ketosteroid isomerase-like protein
MTTISTGLSTVQEGYAAFARGDVAAVLAVMDPDIVWSTPESVPGGGVYRGHAGVGEFFAGLMDRWGELHVEPETWIDGGDYVVALGRHRGYGKSTGTPVDLAFAHVWQLRDGRAIAFTEFFDSAVLAPALAG